MLGVHKACLVPSTVNKQRFGVDTWSKVRGMQQLGAWLRGIQHSILCLNLGFSWVYLLEILVV